MLRPRALDLPETGWGLIRVTEADDGMDEPVEPKTVTGWFPSRRPKS
jgi:hypothetical protein